MGRHVMISCDRCGLTAPGTIDPSWVPIGWGIVEVLQQETERGAKVRDLRTVAQLCRDCSEGVKLKMQPEPTRRDLDGGES